VTDSARDRAIKAVTGRVRAALQRMGADLRPINLDAAADEIAREVRALAGEAGADGEASSAAKSWVSALPEAGPDCGATVTDPGGVTRCILRGHPQHVPALAAAGAPGAEESDHQVTEQWDAHGGDVVWRKCSCGERWTADQSWCPAGDDPAWAPDTPPADDVRADDPDHCQHCGLLICTWSPCCEAWEKEQTERAATAPAVWWSPSFARVGGLIWEHPYCGGLHDVRDVPMGTGIELPSDAVRLVPAAAPTPADEAPTHTELVRAIADPGSFLPRGEQQPDGRSDYSESIPSWSARAVAALLARRTGETR
jgi:hypothetical protein